MQKPAREQGRNAQRAGYALAHARASAANNTAKAFRKAIENKSVDSALGHNNIGVIMAMKSDLAAAEKEFEAALLRSGGRLVEARKNLEFCRSRRTGRTELIGKVEFSFAGRSSEFLL